MRIRLQDLLTALARHNGVTTDSEWPLLATYLRWFLSGGGGTWTTDPACTLFWMDRNGASLRDYWGINIASLTDRIMSAVWGTFMDIRGVNSRTAFVLDHVEVIARSPAVHDLLSETFTTFAYASRFAFEHNLVFPDDLKPKSGRKSGLLYKSWCDQIFNDLVRQGFHRPHLGGQANAAFLIHLLLGGKVDQGTAQKALKQNYHGHLRGRHKPLKIMRI